MADEEWGENEKKDWVNEVGEKKMAAVLIQLWLCRWSRYSCSLLVSLSPVNII